MQRAAFVLLAVASGTAGAALGPGAATAAEPPPPLAVGLAVAAPISPRRLDHALGEVDRILGPGVRVEWREPAGPGPVPPLSVRLERRPAPGVVAGCRRGRHDHRLGQAALGSRRVTLWTEQVARAVHGDWDARIVDPEAVEAGRYGRALGRAMAHELVHVLLRLAGHRSRGLMKGSFSRSALIALEGRAFRLSDGDMRLLRRTAAALAP